MADDDPGPVVQRLVCGEKAREWRLLRHIELVDADARLGKYRGKLSKIETGLLAPKPDETEALIGLYGLTGSDADEFRRLASEARRRSSSESVGTSNLRYVVLERTAVEIRMAYPEVPGLLQTRDFALASLSRSTGITAAELPKQAAARAERGRRILTQDGPKVLAVIGEEALHYEVGSRDILREQIQWLRELADLPTVSLRVFTFTTGVSPALKCPFTLLYLSSPARTFAYVETLTKGDYVKTVQPYIDAFDLTWDLAENESATKRILDRRITDLD
jgi:Domain of unknown function (DUF5753)